MKRTLIPLLALTLVSCGQSRRTMSSTNTLETTDSIVADRRTETVRMTKEQTAETTTSEADESLDITVTETITTVEFSAPDSLGRQHATSKTIAGRRTDSRARKLSARRSETLSASSDSIAVKDTIRSAQKTTTRQTTATISERTRKPGMGGYVRAFLLGAASMAVVFVAVWIYRKRKPI